MIIYCISLNFSYQQLQTIVPAGRDVLPGNVRTKVRQNTRGEIADVDSVAQNQSLHVTETLFRDEQPFERVHLGQIIEQTENLWSQVEFTRNQLCWSIKLYFGLNVVKHETVQNVQHHFQTPLVDKTLARWRWFVWFQKIINHPYSIGMFRFCFLRFFGCNYSKIDFSVSVLLSGLINFYVSYCNNLWQMEIMH